MEEEEEEEEELYSLFSLTFSFILG